MTELSFRLSRAVGRLQRSVMRDLMAMAVDPDIISLAGGLPANDCQPVEEFKECVEHVLTRDGSLALQYGPPYMPLREWIAEYMAGKGLACTPEQILITNGAQQSLAILSRLFADPGDAAVIESITFTGVKQVTAGRGLRVVSVPTDLRTGVKIEPMREAFFSEPRPRFAVLIPDFHNPLGVSISAEKRRLIVEAAREAHVPIIEDDPYSALRFEGDPRPPLAALADGGEVMYIGSFSKMLAPAVRMGWIVLPQTLISRATVLRESIDLESSQLMQRAVAEFVGRGWLQRQLQVLNETNLRRRDLLLAALKEHLAPFGATWTHPQGGLFVWVALAGPVNTAALLKAAIERKVAFIPGFAFAVDGGSRNTLRLNFSNVSDEKINVAVRRIAAVLGDWTG